MKIVYVINALGNAGGMERVLCTKANYLAEKAGMEVHIITQYPLPVDKFFNFSSAINIESLDLPPAENRWVKMISGNGLVNRKYKKKLEARLLQISPDITISMCGNEFPFLHTIMDGSVKIAEFHFSRNYLVHLVLSIHSLRFRSLRLLRVQWLQYRQRKYARHYQQVVLLTKADQRLWGNHSNMCTIPNPLSKRVMATAELNNTQVIAIGRLIAQKGFDLLIESFSLLAEKYPQWKLVIFGDGPDKDYLNKLILQHELPGRIFIRQPVKEVQEEIIQSSVFAFSSRYEGFGLVLTEAMECGLPCVAFDCECGPAEILRNGEDGFLIQEGNATAFAKQLGLLMGDIQLRRQMGAKAKENVRRFYEAPVMNEWINLFAALVEKKKRQQI